MLGVVVFYTFLAGGRRISISHYYANSTHTHCAHCCCIIYIILLCNHIKSSSNFCATMLILMLLLPLLKPADNTFAATGTLSRFSGPWYYIANWNDTTSHYFTNIHSQIIQSHTTWYLLKAGRIMVSVVGGRHYVLLHYVDDSAPNLSGVVLCNPFK